MRKSVAPWSRRARWQNASRWRFYLSLIFPSPAPAATRRHCTRFIGSIAFVGAPRAAFAVIEDAENDGRMLLLHAKNNMTAKPQGLAYRLVQTLVGPEQNIVASYVAWDSVPVSISANDALRATEEGHDRSAKAEATEFLRAALSEGAVPAGEISRMARDHGLTTKVVRSAREALGVKIDRDGFGPGSKSVWSLTAAPILAQTVHRCPIQGMGKYGGGGQVWEPSKVQGRLSDGVHAPAIRPPGPSSSVSDPTRDDDPEMPDFLRRPPPGQPQANGRAPALGPLGDSLDDFR